MGGLAEIAAVTMANGQKRIDVTAGNIGNLNSPGFRSQKVFQRILDGTTAIPHMTAAKSPGDGAPALKQTGNPLDMAVTGRATLLLRDGERLVAANSIQASRTVEGRLVDGLGRALQAAGGGDLIVGSGEMTILRDGAVLVSGLPETRVGLFAPASVDTVPEPAEGGVLYQGMLVPSDVDLADEMVALTQAGRTVETGAKIFAIYDDLLSKVASQLGNAGQ